MYKTQKKLTWGLVISTYKREAILARCLSLATQQTFPPKEIIVVDASPYWEGTRDQIMQELAIKYPTIDWKYVQAKRASLTAQRNQGIDLTTTDILFLIDDDSLMYPDCAEEIMRIYTSDTEHKVVGVMSAMVPTPPDKQTKINQPKKSNLLTKIKVNLTQLRQFFLHYYSSKKIRMLYYYETFPKFTLPDELKNMSVTHYLPMHGARMTYRSEIFNQIRFEEILERISFSEDVDMSFRASRFGLQLCAQKAKICHLEASEGRLSLFMLKALWGLNVAVLQRLNSCNLVRSKKRLSTLFFYELIVKAFSDLLSRRLSFPATRGVFFGYKYYKYILSMELEELHAWYPQFQRKLIQLDAAASSPHYSLR